eukprot:NODE_2667_length_896_cov_49.042806.p1 GENE.NODE_2667_length_896_cov_49.042806~~NODE_2667_length_896_cov_49.042806.p1  ORF type:complete len:245 (-),score=28.69 NODE_2667_length_896_cov_49.042806:62-796(-)
MLKRFFPRSRQPRNAATPGANSEPRNAAMPGANSEQRGRASIESFASSNGTVGSLNSEPHAMGSREGRRSTDSRASSVSMASIMNRLPSRESIRYALRPESPLWEDLALMQSPCQPCSYQRTMLQVQIHQARLQRRNSSSSSAAAEEPVRRSASGLPAANDACASGSSPPTQAVCSFANACFDDGDLYLRSTLQSADLPRPACSEGEGPDDSRAISACFEGDRDSQREGLAGARPRALPRHVVL